MIIESPHETPVTGHGNSRADQRGQSRSILIGLAVSLLIHGFALWYILHKDDLILKAPGGNADNRLTVSILSPSPAAAPVPPTPSRPKLAQATPPAPKRKPPPAKKQNNKPAPEAKRQTTQTAKAAPNTSIPPIAKADRSRLSLPDDFSAQLDAARKRRGQTAEESGLPEPETEAATQEAPKNDNSVAMANIAFSMKHSGRGDKDDVGGVFQLRRVGIVDAELVFRGWGERSRRNATRLFTVEKGSNADIETALVKKVIDIIREEKKEDFVWESKRLGKPITLSARPQDNSQLEHFMLREFFPDYVPSSSRG